MYMYIYIYILAMGVFLVEFVIVCVSVFFPTSSYLHSTHPVLVSLLLLL